MVEMALAGAGLTVGMAETFSPWLRDGQYARCWTSFVHRRPDYPFYSSRRHLAAKLGAMIDHVKEWRRR
jgi:DNA-binding transcriptional LysR family regulator